MTADSMTAAPDANDPHRSDPVGDDPIRRRREQIRRLVGIANRVGYLLLVVAIVVFFIGVATDFTSTKAAIIVATLVASCVLLAPTIVLGYAVKAADRDDRERGF